MGIILQKVTVEKLKVVTVLTHMLHWVLALVWMSKTYCTVLTSDILLLEKGGHVKILSTSGPQDRTLCSLTAM